MFSEGNNSFIVGVKDRMGIKLTLAVFLRHCVAIETVLTAFAVPTR